MIGVKGKHNQCKVFTQPPQSKGYSEIKSFNEESDIIKKKSEIFDYLASSKEKLLIEFCVLVLCYIVTLLFLWSY